MTTQEIAKAIVTYAKDHYEDGGWDVLVECWSLPEIEELIPEGTSLSDALASFQSLAAVWAERQADAIHSAY